MYFGHGGLTFDRLVAFLTGLDVGTNGAMLDGFREYLILRLGEESSQWWPGLAIRVTSPDAAPRPSTEDDDRVAVDGILELLDEFLAEFPEGRSRKRLYHEYYLWKQHLSFFNLDLERFRSSPAPDLVSIDVALATLGVPRKAMFDMVAAGDLEVFRAAAELKVRRSTLDQLRAAHAEDSDDRAG